MWRASSCHSGLPWAIPFPLLLPQTGAVGGSACFPCGLALCPSAAWSQRSCSAEMQRNAWGSQRHSDAEKDALPLALKNIVTGWGKKNDFRKKRNITACWCSPWSAAQKLPSPASASLLCQSLKKHIHVATNAVVTEFLCLAAGFSLSVLLLQNLTHRGILLGSRVPNSAGKPLTSNLTLSKKKSSWSQGGISLCAAFKERVWEHQIGLKVGSSRTHSPDSQEKCKLYQRKVFY